FTSRRTTRRSFMGLLLLPIPITLIPIQATCRERLWRGVRELRWVLPLGALGAATGAIAIGTVATLRSTTIIITIRTTISTATSAARDRVIGSTIRNTGEMHPMGTGKQRISTAARLEAKAEGGPVLELELVLVQAELEHVPVAALELVIDLVVVELGLPIGLGVEPERAIGLAVAGVVKPTVLVAAAELGLPIGPAVVPELETAQVVAPELELVQVAVALRTRSVTA